MVVLELDVAFHADLGLVGPIDMVCLALRVKTDPVGLLGPSIELGACPIVYPHPLSPLTVYFRVPDPGEYGLSICI